MRYISLLIIVLRVCCVQAQSVNEIVDSLEASLTKTQYDTTRINNLNVLTYQLIRIYKLEKAIKYGRESMDLSEKIGYKKGLAYAWCNVGMVKFYLSETEQALAYMTKSVDLHKAIANKQGLAFTYKCLAQVYSDGKDNHMRALDLFKLALTMQSELGDSLEMVQSYLGLARVYTYLGDHSKAIKYQDTAIKIQSRLRAASGMSILYHNRAATHRLLGDNVLALKDFYTSLKISEKTGEAMITAACRNEIGQIFLLQGNIDKAMVEFKNALKISHKINDKTGLGITLHHMGKIYRRKHDYKNAFDCFNEALQIQLENGENGRAANTYKDLGLLFYLKKELDTATIYYLKGIEIVEKLKFKLGMADLYCHIGDAYLSQNKPLKARQYVEKALPIAVDLKNNRLLKEIFFTLSKSDSALGNFKSAFGNYKVYTDYKDSLNNEEKDKKISQIAMQYEFDLKADSLKYAKSLSDQQLLLQASLLKSTKQNRNIMIIALFVCFSFLCVMFYRRNQRKRLLYLRQLDLMEIKALKSQMNPHFIFNALNSIYNFVQLNKTELAASYIIKFSKLMRLILKNSMEPSISLKSELEALQLYVDLEKERLSHSFMFEIKIHKDIIQEETQVPPLIFQPFVENSIWHGISGHPVTGLILLEVYKDGELLKCAITDNGIGRKNIITANGQKYTGKKENDRSYGVQLTKERIEVLHKMKKTKGINDEKKEVLEIHDLYTDEKLPAGVKVEFTLPFELAS